MGFLNNKAQYKIWVFAPYFETEDSDLQFLDITLDNFNRIINMIVNLPSTNIVLNLCDGDELNGVPGISVVNALEKSTLIYTGADAFFYHITTSKIDMKKAFDVHEVPNAKWIVFDNSINETLFNEIGTPAIIKPAVSAGSMGLTVKNVVQTFSECQTVLQEMGKGYHGWNLDAAGLLAETFIKGREFTSLIVGSSTMPDKIKFYTPIERVFHDSLPEEEKFLSFDRLWETYTDESAMPEGAFFYEYAAVTDLQLLKSLEKLSKEAFLSLKGMGYGRIDFRLSNETGKLFVLEVNAQCGLSEDENYTSIGAILRFSNETFTSLIVEILDDAIARSKSPKK
ncbi:MAG: hypothetical protein NT153_09510 [Bacteroidetes bacterium]|nr:hypothetical protein [Bacteroidota bacterium]